MNVKGGCEVGNSSDPVSGLMDGICEHSKGLSRPSKMDFLYRDSKFKFLKEHVAVQWSDLVLSYCISFVLFYLVASILACYNSNYI